MSKSIYLLPILFILAIFSCTSNNEDMEVEQDYTSFVFQSESISELKYCVVGHKLSDNSYKKIADLGDLTKGIASKEVRVADENIKEVYFFSYIGTTTTRADKSFNIERNKKNIFKLTPDLYGIKVEDITDPLQYPQ